MLHVFIDTADILFGNVFKIYTIYTLIIGMNVVLILDFLLFL